MIKFFQKIRQNLLLENKTGKYLKYAVGEIILVVIGILIALSINNWNEQRKQNLNYINILKAIKNDMMIDTLRIEFILKEYKDDEPAFLLSQKDTISKEEYLECKECPRIFGSFLPMFVQTIGHKRMQAFNVEADLEKDSLNQKINMFYAVYAPSIEKSVDVITDLLFENDNAFRDKEPWYKDWNEKIYTDDFYETALHDPIYKNRVSQYYRYIYLYYLRILKTMKNEEEKLLEIIDKKLNSNSK